MLATWRRIRFHRLRAMSHPMSLHPTGQSRVLSSTSAHMLGCFSRVGLCNSTYYSRPGSPIREVLQARVLYHQHHLGSPQVLLTTGYKSSSCVSSLSFWLLPRLPVYYKGYKATARWRDTQGKIPNKGASVLLEFGAQLRGYGSSLVPQPGNSLKPIL